MLRTRQLLLMLPFVLLTCATALAFVNGANDNMKGVASLIGSRVLPFRAALLWANLTTFCGVLAAVLLYRGLAAAFSGQGLVPSGIAGHQQFMITAVSAAAATVYCATCIGLPVSTTHALVGGICGAALAAAPADLAWGAISRRFIMPLAFAPLLAALATILFATILKAARRRGLGADSCVCVAEAPCLQPVPVVAALSYSEPAASPVTVMTGTTESCRDSATGLPLAGLTAASLGNFFHLLSAGAVCFARGLNDAPKIAAMSLVAFAVPGWTIFLAIGIAMTIGALLQSRRVSHTMSENITEMPSGQAMCANMVTAALVLGASRFGMPVSTTHVSCGALFGLGASTGTARWKMISGIIAAWLATLPIAALLGFGIYPLLQSLL